MTAAGLPASPSLEAARTASPTSTRNGDAQPARTAPRRRKPSDVRMSVPKLLAHLTDELGAERARDLVFPLLTERQRQEVADADACPQNRG